MDLREGTLPQYTHAENQHPIEAKSATKTLEKGTKKRLDKQLKYQEALKKKESEEKTKKRLDKQLQY